MPPSRLTTHTSDQLISVLAWSTGALLGVSWPPAHATAAESSDGRLVRLIIVCTIKPIDCSALASGSCVHSFRGGKLHGHLVNDSPTVQGCFAWALCRGPCRYFNEGMQRESMIGSVVGPDTKHEQKRAWVSPAALANRRSPVRLVNVNVWNAPINARLLGCDLF